MGTRGVMSFEVDGKVKGMYNHWDSYPTGLGEDIGGWIKTMDKDQAIKQFHELQQVGWDDAPTEDQKMALLRYADFSVSERNSDDWYVLLRGTQGDPQKTLDAIYYVDGTKMGGLEWGYTIDLTNEVLRVYSYNYSDRPQPCAEIPFAEIDHVDWEALENLDEDDDY